MELEGKAQKILRQMQAENRVTTLSRKASFKIDHEVALAFTPIKQESERKQKASRRAYRVDLDSGEINSYK